jgi:hypothetical protein
MAMRSVLFPPIDSHLFTSLQIDERTERMHRVHGVSLLHSCWKMLISDDESESLASLCFATSATILHRFYHAVSLDECNVWSAAMACSLLAAKLHEVPLAIKQIIILYSHLYKKRATLLSVDEPSVRKMIELSHASISVMELGDPPLPQLNNLITGISPTGPIWKEWFDAIVETENKILRKLGFTLYWIPNEHPHKFLDHILRALGIDDNVISRNAWEYCNDAMWLDLSTRFASQIVACAAIQLSVLDAEMKVSDKCWNSLCGPGAAQKVHSVCTALIGLMDADNVDVKAASLGFIRSKEPGGSFNDPESFVWEMASSAISNMSAP